MNMLIILVYVLIQISNCHIDLEKLQQNQDIILDCNYTFEEAVKGIDIPNSVLKQLTLIDVDYYSFDDRLHKGQLIVNKKVLKDIEEIFGFIKESKFPVAKVIPATKYNWNDEASMNDNNTVAFNYRNVKGSKVLSAHSNGMAIDINPLQNPHIKGKVIHPASGKYDVKVRGTIIRDSKLVKEFVKRNWQWGGSWKSSKDYQHFEKRD
jgi:hypothetical protein